MSISEPASAQRVSKIALLADLRRLKGRLSVPVLLYLLAIVLPMSINLGPLHMSGTRLLLIVLIIPLSVGVLLGRYGKVLFTDIMFFLYIFWAILALAINNPDRVVQYAGATGIEFIGGYVVGRAYIRSRADFIALIRALILILLLCLPLAVFEALTGTAVILNVLNKLPMISSLVDVSIDKRLGLDRAQVFLSHPIHWGLYCSLIMSLCFVGLKDIYSNTARFFIVIAAAAGGFLALSSGAILAIVLQFALIIWAWMFRNTHKRWWILLGLFVVCYVVVDLLSNRSPIRVFMSYATFSAHSAYWRALIFEWGMVNVWANPFVGLGLNDWIRPIWMHTPSVDNFWLINAMRYGIPAFVFLALGYGVVLVRVGLRNFESDRVLWNLRRAWMFGFLGLTFTLTTVHVWGSIYSFVFFMFGAGVWMMFAEPEDAEQASDSPKVYGKTRGGFARDHAAQSSFTRGSVAPPPRDKPPHASETSRHVYTRFSPQKNRQKK